MAPAPLSEMEAAVPAPCAQPAAGAAHSLTGPYEALAEQVRGLTDGKGVHVVTVNDYLAKRDSEWMGKVYAQLGMTTGVVYSHQPDAEKMAAYRADIEAAEDPKAELLKIEARLNALRSPFRSAEKFWVEEIIDPRQTRKQLVDFMHLAEPLRTPGLKPMTKPPRLNASMRSSAAAMPSRVGRAPCRRAASTMTRALM